MVVLALAISRNIPDGFGCDRIANSGISEGITNCGIGKGIAHGLIREGVAH